MRPRHDGHTRRTKADLTETLDMLARATRQATERTDNQASWLVAKGAHAALRIACGLCSGGYDATKFDDAQLVSILGKDLRGVLELYRDYLRFGDEPWVKDQD